jgi:hypothetical protein
MDEKLNQLITAAQPEDMDDGMMDEMKEDYLGGKARYVFPCFSCGTEVKTQNKYWTSDNYVTDSVKQGAADAAEGLSAKLFGWIPLFGRYFKDRAERKIESMEDKADENKMFKFQQKAYEEVKDQFHRCTKCGTYACSSCFADGLCQNCRTMAEAQQQIEAAKNMQQQ